MCKSWSYEVYFSLRHIISKDQCAIYKVYSRLNLQVDTNALGAGPDSAVYSVSLLAFGSLQV